MVRRRSAGAAGLLAGLAGVLAGLGFGPAYAAQEEPGSRVLTAFADREITESSGLVDAGDVLHTVNDSGSGPQLFTVDARTGETVGVTTYGEEVEDVEALAPAPGGAVWVADIGDNLRQRDTVQLYLVRPGSDETAPAYSVAYPGGARDAETLLAHPRTGRLFVVTKTVFGGVVHALPRRLEAGAVHRTRPFAQVPGLLTGGEFLPDGRHVLLRGYAFAALYSFPDFREVGRFALPAQDQGEALAVGRDGRILLSSEGVGSDVLEVELPETLAAQLRRDDRRPTPVSPSPATPPRADPARIGESDAPWGWWAAGALGGGLLAVVALLSTQARRRPDTGRD